MQQKANAAKGECRKMEGKRSKMGDKCRKLESTMTDRIIFSFTKTGTELNRKICRMYAEKNAEMYRGKCAGASASGGAAAAETSVSGRAEAAGTCQGYAVEKYALEYEKDGILPLPDPVREFIGQWWGKSAFIFIGAAGIAVRYIAPFVKDKFTDSPVLVIDEKGQYVIPILSGHVGGAASLADEIAAEIGAAAVHTTATDVQQKFAVDVFAKRNNLLIGDRTAAKKISAAVLEGERIGFYIACKDVEIRGNIPGELILCKTAEEVKRQEYRIIVDGYRGKENACPDQAAECPGAGPLREENTLVLHPRRITAGIGCRRGISPELLEKGFLEVLGENGILPGEVEAIASIDLKKDEPALLALSEKYGIPFFTYSAEQLNEIPAVSSKSAFVKEITGVDNVCERAALYHLRHSKGAGLIREKWKGEQMTAALAVRPAVLEFF